MIKNVLIIAFISEVISGLCFLVLTILNKCIKFLDLDNDLIVACSGMMFVLNFIALLIKTIWF